MLVQRQSNEVSVQELAHTCYWSATKPAIAKDLGQFLVREEVVRVLRVSKVVVLDVSPELLDALSPGSLCLAHDVGKLGGELHGLGESRSPRHVEFLRFTSLGFRRIERQTVRCWKSRKCRFIILQMWFLKNHISG